LQVIIPWNKMNEINDMIKSRARQYLEEVREIRHHLHQHPELSTREVETAAFICRKLDEYGIFYINGVAGNGVVGTITGKSPEGRCIALRADMDALPIREENRTEYVSQTPGQMHACGHDAHMAALLGAARILQDLREHFAGTIKLLFQPSEETYPGGAIQMIEAGVLEHPRVEHVIGQHVFPLLDAGQVGFRPGAYMASTDEVYLVVKGRGGHAASPQLSVDPILIASHIIVALQQIVSRNANPVIPTVLSFGRIIGEGRTNVLPDEVRIDGTIRTYDEEWRKEIHRRIETIASSVAVGMGGSCQVKIDAGYPFLENDEELTRTCEDLASKYLGYEHVFTLDRKMTAEDFSYFCRAVPSCFYRFGIRNEPKGITSNLHSSTFDIDESSLETASGLMAWLAYHLVTKT
jgi:amidohydrolase